MFGIIVTHRQALWLTFNPLSEGKHEVSVNKKNFFLFSQIDTNYIFVFFNKSCFPNDLSNLILDYERNLRHFITQVQLC